MFACLSHLSISRRPRGLCLLVWALTLVASFAGAAEETTQSWADKMLEKNQHDFGTLENGTSATHAIKISNLYKETVTISELGTSSPDIRVSADKTVLESKDTAQLVLSLDPAVNGRQIDGQVTLKMTFDGVTFKTVTVPVKAIVKGGTTPPQPAPNRHPGRNWAEQMFTELQYNYGSVARGAEAKHIIEITNLYKEDVTITTPISSCGCITPTIDAMGLNDRFVLKSKEKAQLVLKLDTIKFSRKRDVTVSLRSTFDNLNYKEIRIPITAYIRSDVVFEPGSVQFGTVSPGEAREQRVRVKYAGRANWTVRSVRASNPHLQPVIREVSRFNGNVEYDLLVKLAGTAPLGRLLDQVVLETDDALNPTIPLLVEGQIEADLQVTPQVVQFGTLKPGEKKLVNVVVTGRRPFRIENVECDSARECYVVAKQPTDKTVHVIGLTITPPAEPGELKEAFTVTIAGRKAPLTFQAIGKIEMPADSVTPTESSTSEPAPAESNEKSPEVKDSESELKEPVTETLGTEPVQTETPSTPPDSPATPPETTGTP